jgi:predicted dehydrogenase
MNDANHDNVTRRDFVRSSAAVTAAAAISPAMIARTAFGASGDEFKVGLIGCGGRGTGAAVNAMQADPAVRIVAMGDLFQDRLEDSRGRLKGHNLAERVTVTDATSFSGFDAYKQVLDTDIDIVILATPPHFRPMQFAAAIDAGKHAFIEKPVGVDSTGIRTVLAAGDRAKAKGLCVVAGTQRRHEASYLAAIQKVHEGAIGDIVSARAYWNQGGLWVHERQSQYSDIEWQIRNWLYFDWASGDHIVEQHVHNLDVVNWATGEFPISAMGMGGRQVRTDAKYGNIFDHHAIEYIYPSGVHMLSMCRQIDGCASRVEEVIHGTKGKLTTRPGFAVIEGQNPWRFEDRNPSPYVQEHKDLIAAIRSGETINESFNVAYSTLTAIMGRLTTYTGKLVDWDTALNLKMRLGPDRYEFGSFEPGPVATPGRTALG